ncbi:hypothetical protein A9Q81_05905 [Gammaproteobacteria bacterium 42_54_T18]|nr:hypothetical protein A9Q81_05905 [Gammaproteobacteria bacterium 42_54_T18]
MFELTYFEIREPQINNLEINCLFQRLFPITLWSPTGFAEKVLNEAFIYGVFYGSMLIILIYNLFIYISIRNVSYLFYVLYLGGVTLVEFIETGHCSMFFGGITTVFQVKYIPFYIWYTLFIALLFMRSFLNTPHYHPRIDPMIKVLSIIVVTNGVITFFADFHTAIIFVSIFIISIVPGVIAFIYYSMRRGNENARFFFYAWFLNLIGMLIFVGVVLGIVPSTPLTLASMPLGILSEAILLAFALADRIKRTEKAVLDRNQQSRGNLYRYRSVFNNAIEGMYQMTLKGRFTITNPALAKILGFDSNDALMESEKTAVSRCYTDPPANYSQLNKTGCLLVEVYYQRVDGRDVWANHSAQLISDGCGRPKYIEGTLIDITQRKEKEKIQREMACERVSKDIAHAASIAKSKFLATMSHEIRTPLTAIVGYSELLKDTVMSAEEKQQAIETLIGSSRDLLNLINDILDFSKIEAKKLDIEKLPVNLFHVFRDLYAEFGVKAREQQLLFEINFHFPLSRQVTTDPIRLKQVLTNLCVNALIFTEKGGVTIDVAWSEVREQMQFSVSDTGIGFTDAECGALFQVFAQPDTSITRPLGGTGLGLAIAKQLTELMGGAIEVKSTVGSGSRFTVFIGSDVPNRSEWVSCDEGVLSAPAPSMTQKAKTTSTIKSRSLPKLEGTILLAEDNGVNQVLIQRVIQKTGVKVFIAGDGQEAVEMAIATPYDLILMDVNMPIMDGLEATRMLRSSGQELPIYVLTAEHGKAEVDASLEAGCNGHLTKPLDVKKLFLVLEAHLNSIVDG